MLVFNSSVCVAELAAGVGHADPALPTWRPMREHYKAVIEKMQPSRIITPDSVVWSEAGLIAGVLARIQNYQRQQRLDCLNDALILLSAARVGLSVLTENRKDFDLIQQLVPAVRFIHYQAVK